MEDKVSLKELIEMLDKLVNDKEHFDALLNRNYDTLWERQFYYKWFQIFKCFYEKFSLYYLHNNKWQNTIKK